jgi:hypothetical protein
MNPTPIHPHQSKPLPIRLLLSRPRLLICTVIGLAIVGMLPPSLARQSITRAIIGWNLGAGL